MKCPGGIGMSSLENENETEQKVMEELKTTTKLINELRITMDAMSYLWWFQILIALVVMMIAIKGYLSL